MAYSAPINFLVAPELAEGYTATVGNTGVTADDHGQKIIPAGTPVSGENFLLDGTVVLQPTKSGDTNVVGVLSSDVNVTAGNVDTTVYVAGTVNLSALSSDLQALYTDAVTKQLPHVIFLKR